MKLHGHDLILRFMFFNLFDSVRRQKFDRVRPFLLSRRQTSKRDVIREGAIDRAHWSKALAWIRLPEIPGELVVVDDGPVHRIIVDGYSPVRLQMIGHRFVESDQACLSACWPTSDEKDENKRDHRRGDSTCSHDDVTRRLWCWSRGPRCSFALVHRCWVTLSTIRRDL